MPLTKQPPTFTRAGSLSGQVDAHGTSFAVGYNAPGWTRADFDDDGSWESIALRQVRATPHLLSWPVPVRQTIALTGYCMFIDQRPGSQAGYYVLDLSWATATSEFAIGVTATSQYVALFYDGSTSRVSTSGAVGGSGSVVEASATLSTTGIVQLSTSIDGGAVVVASAAAALSRPVSTTALLYGGGKSGDAPTRRHRVHQAGGRHVHAGRNAGDAVMPTGDECQRTERRKRLQRVDDASRGQWHFVGVGFRTPVQGQSGCRPDAGRSGDARAQWRGLWRCRRLCELLLALVSGEPGGGEQHLLAGRDECARLRRIDLYQC